MMRAEESAEESTPLLGGVGGGGGVRNDPRRRRRSNSRERGRQGRRVVAPDDNADEDANNNSFAQQQQQGHFTIDNNPSEDDLFLKVQTPIRPPYPTSRRRFLRRATTADGYSGGVTSFDDLAPDNVGTPPRVGNGDRAAKKRRNLWQRARQFIRQMVQLPTMGYQNLDASEGGGAAALPYDHVRCTLGTREVDGTWLNYTDQAGTAMALLVWVLIGYCAGTMIVLARHGHMAVHVCAAQVTLSVLIWACHAKTMLTDPGTIPSTAVPLVTKGVKFHTMCSVCQSYKPSYTHHCRICNRCISRMDHHCPWMNNCVGAGNLKHFTLFLVYSWLGSFSALCIFGWNYFFCRDQNCEFHGLEIQLVRAMSLICFGTLMFTSSMLMNVVYGIMTGTGTIDRLKQKADATWHLSDEQPTPLEHIWGTGPKVGWCLPVDPVWEDFGKLMGYTTTESLVQGDNLL